MTTLQATTIPFVDLTRQHQPIAEQMRAAYDRVMLEGSFTLGTEVDAFEAEFASFLGARYAVGVGSGTDALHLALRACGVGEGDEVITAVNTFAATAEAIVMCGATPVFADIDPATYLIDPDAVEDAVTERTKAIIPVHLYGQCADMERIGAIARKHDLKVIEDACQAHGASTKGLMAGTAGDAGCFSFYPSKNLGAAGDGGMIVTNDDAVAARTRLLRNHGEDGQRLHLEPGYCSRLHGMQAALLRVKLRELPKWNDMRAAAASQYVAALSGSSAVLPTIAPGARHVFHLFVVQVAERDRFRQALDRRHVQTAVHYPVPLHLEPAFTGLGYRPGQFPVAEAATSRIVSLPMFPYMTEDELQRTVEAVLEATDD